MRYFVLSCLATTVLLLGFAAPSWAQQPPEKDKDKGKAKLVDKHGITRPREADLGAALKKNDKGLLVLDVVTGSLADQMKLTKGCVIYEFNGDQVGSRDDVTKAIGKKVDMTVKFYAVDDSPAKFTTAGKVYWLPATSEKMSYSKYKADKEERTTLLKYDPNQTRDGALPFFVPDVIKKELPK